MNRSTIGCMKYLGTMLILLGISISCGEPISSPWQLQLPKDRKDSTARNLALIEAKAITLPFTVGIIADPQGTPEDLERVVKKITTHQVAFILVLGDLTDFGLIEEFAQTYDALETSTVPYLTTIGNHDAISHGKEIYNRMFGPFDYTFTVVGFKFIMWNNNKFEFGNNNFQWLQSQLQDDAVVSSHIPPVQDVHSQAEVDEWLSMYDGINLAASLHGHRGTTRAFFELYQGIPIYTAPKTSGSHYSIVHFTSDRSLQIFKCDRACVQHY